MNQSIDVVSLVVGVVFVAVGAWLVGDTVSARPSLSLLIPAVGILAVVTALATSRRARSNNAPGHHV